MATVQGAYGTSNQALTITLNSLASSATAGRSSAAVDNSSEKLLDALVRVNIAMPGSGTVANDKACYVYAYGSADGGTSYDDGVAGTDSAFTHSSPPNLRLIGVVSCPTNTGTYRSPLMSVAAAFGGQLPERWGIVVRNYTGVTLNSSGNSAHYQGIKREVV